MAWEKGNRTIDYEYDANGSLTKKTTKETGSGLTVEIIEYVYNLQGRLETVTTTPYVDNLPDTPNISTTAYKYNPQGIRVEKDVDGTVTRYLIDRYNHTGYAQVLEEWSTGGSTPDVTYTIGDDVMTQSDSTGIHHILYDGHGSTRHLVDHAYTVDGSGVPYVTDSYSYDGYGVMLQDSTAFLPSGTGNPGKIPKQTANLLYAGEYFDANAQHYYNRARYYNPYNGRFNRTDPYASSPQDPQSLHKYLYCHNNPANGSDPDGHMFIVDVVFTCAVQLIIRKIDAAAVAVTTWMAASKTVAIVAGLLAISNLYVLATDSEALDFFVASCGGDLTMASGIIAMDIQAIRNMGGTLKGMLSSGSNVAKEARNVIHIRRNDQPLLQFRRKTTQVKNAANNGGLVYAGSTGHMQTDANKARISYRSAVKKRLISWFKHRGMSRPQAIQQAEQVMRNRQVDHIIDLQVSGALANPNLRRNLHMLDSSTNQSVGKQIELECKRLNLEPGDTIHDVIINE